MLVKNHRINNELFRYYNTLRYDENHNDISLFLVNFNNDFITSNCILSLLKKIDFKINVIIVDNSNSIRINNIFTHSFNVIDNFQHKLLPCQYEQYYNMPNDPNSVITRISPSKNHSLTIDYALKNIVKTKYCIVCDNDIIFKNTEFLNYYKDYDLIYEAAEDICPPKRLLPYFFIINVNKFNELKLNFYDENNCMNAALGHIFMEKYDSNNNKHTISVGNYNDTGASFYKEISSNNLLNKKEIQIDNYIEHFNNGSHIFNKLDLYEKFNFQPKYFNYKDFLAKNKEYL